MPERAVPRILVVEDNAALAENVCDILAEQGFEAEVAASAEAALRALSAREFHGVVTDLRLPGMSGIELLRTMRESGRTAPVVVVTAFADPSTVAAAEELGALDVLQKPVDFKRLFGLVDEFRGDEPKVLVVEDSKDLAESIAHALREKAITPIVARTVQSALAQRHLPQAAVVDIRLPDGSGLDVVHRLQSRDPSIQVLLTTGEVDETASPNGAKLEAPVLRKPVDVERLLSLITAGTRWAKPNS